MKKIILPRQGGKTFKLIKISEETQKYIVCLDKNRVNNIWKMSLDMDCDIPYPITFYELQNLQGSSANRDGVLVDDMDDIVQRIILNAFNGLYISVATFTDDKIKYPINISGY